MITEQEAGQLVTTISSPPVKVSPGIFPRIVQEVDGHETPGYWAREPSRSPCGCQKLRSAHRRLIEELYLAEQVYAQLLRHPLPTPPRVSLAASIRPVHHLAGDFYNASRLDASRVGVYVGDVMGHGPAAALLGIFAIQAMVTRKVWGNQYEILPPDVALGHLNDVLMAADIPGSPFITMSYGILDTEAATWTYCGAGHPPALLFRDGQPPRALEPNSPLLGVLDLPFHASTVDLEPGDRLLLYSDGAMTATWAEHGAGLDGLIATFAQRRDDVPAQQQVDEALAGMTFPPGAPADDVALMLTEFRP